MNNQTIWKCAQYYKNRCKAELITGDGKKVFLKGEHLDHTPTYEKKNLTNLKKHIVDIYRLPNKKFNLKK